MTVGTGGTAGSVAIGFGTSGGTTSFGSYVVCTGGAYYGSGGPNGTATLTGYNVSKSKYSPWAFSAYSGTITDVTGQGSTTWSINYSTIPGTPFAPTSAVTDGNGMGGAVWLVY